MKFAVAVPSSINVRSMHEQCRACCRSTCCCWEQMRQWCVLVLTAAPAAKLSAVLSAGWISVHGVTSEQHEW